MAMRRRWWAVAAACAMGARGAPNASGTWDIEEARNVVFIKTGKCASTQGALTTHMVSRWLHRSRERQPGRVSLGSTCRDRSVKDVKQEIRSHGGEPIVHATHAERRFTNTAVLTLKHFIWTVVRHPLPRCLSWYYFQNRRKPKERRSKNQTAAEKIDFLKSMCFEYVFAYLAPRDVFAGACARPFAPVFPAIDAPGADRAAAAVLAHYDFVATVERFDESLVALARVVGVPLSQVLYDPRDVKTTNANPHAALADEPSELLAYAADEFPKANRRDYALWDLATAALEARTQAPGFQADLVDFRARLANGEVPIDPFKNASARPPPPAKKAAPKQKRPKKRVEPKKKPNKSYYRKQPATTIADPTAREAHAPDASPGDEARARSGPRLSAILVSVLTFFLCVACGLLAATWSLLRRDETDVAPVD